MTAHTIALPYISVQSDSSTGGQETFYPVTPYMNAGEVGKVRGPIELVWKTGNLNVSLAYQTADVENAPGTAAAIGSYATSAGVTYPTQYTDIASSANAKQLIRFGFLVKLSSGSTLSYGYVGGSLQIMECS